MTLLPIGNMTSQQQYLLDSHPSIQASMDDFEAREFSPTVPEIPSQHSGFREGYSAQNSECSEATSSRRSHSPPAWRKAGSGWFKHQTALSPGRNGFNSNNLSPQYYIANEDTDDGDVTAYRSASRIPLPESPVKGRSPSNSPELVSIGAAAEGDKGGGRGKDTGIHTTVRNASEQPATEDEDKSLDVQTPTQNNYIRFSTSLDVVQRTEPIEAVINGVRQAIRHFTKSTYNTIFYTVATLFFYWLVVNLFKAPSSGPSPDLLKVAGLAKSFEPAIYYSEHGHAQIEQLQDTGIAVWDLGESVRSTNMTSAPVIVKQLDQLSEDLKTLAIELTRFFAAVDADIDGILLVMEWAQRELANVSNEPPTTIGSLWSNAHSMLTKAGLMSENRLVQDLLGMTYQQRTKATLERTFFEFLGVLEESITHELEYSTKLFRLFEAVDGQFLNLQRTVIREQDQQERMENDFLSSLWTKVIGVNASKLRKYEKNKNLLHSVRDRTLRNKHTLLDHNQRLLQLQSNLEMLRRKLASPLVRSSNSSTLTVDEQIQGLESTYHQLKSTRENQKQKMMELIYGAGSRRVTLPGEARGIDPASVHS